MFWISEERLAERERKRQERVRRLGQKLHEWATLDRCVDLSVDILLLVLEVITSPILILVRILRWFLNLWFVNKIKAGARWIAHWFERKREYRLKHGHGIFRTYWWLILLSPLIISVIGTSILLYTEFLACWRDPMC